jgi:energy-coupling factor transporter ATP-binding protein EcfA2
VRQLTVRRSAADLPARLAALEIAVEQADGRVEDAVVAEAREVLARADERMRLSDHTVVALAGPTGSGKSSIFNVLAGLYLSPAGVRRPTTGTTFACVWGTDSAGPLLDWLDVPRRHARESVLDLEPQSDLDGLVLLDLPDHDSTEAGHRVEVDRLVQMVDLFVWVMDPQKYADAALHDRYLRPLAGHADVTVVVLNQVDRLGSRDADRCAADLAKLLAADGLEGVRVIKTSAQTGQGLDELRKVLGERVAERRARADRLAADVARVSRRLASFCGDPGRAGVGSRERAKLLAALGAAAGVPAVAEAVRSSYVSRAVVATGWPVTRWLRLLRPDPLRRLHLDGAGRTSLAGPTPVQRSQVDTAVRAVVEDVSEGMPQAWIDAVRRAARSDEDRLADTLDAAIGGTDLGMDRRPVWWRLGSALQWLLLAVAVLGAVWLLALVGFSYLRLPQPGTPEVGDVPVPTLMLIGGELLGILLAGVTRLFGAIGGRRRKRRAEARMREQIEQVAQRQVLEPVAAEVDRYQRFCRALGDARR